ncbi:hypothetical protein [Rhodoblastus sp.]|uniref:hypothetical protein n=1 Tax=Rhodoblastus sp. TaxID=1962975 RepID=UPI00261D4178|nr:hypothetical protein [Rhodoblastus sp.]
MLSSKSAGIYGRWGERKIKRIFNPRGLSPQVFVCTLFSVPENGAGPAHERCGRACGQAIRLIFNRCFRACRDVRFEFFAPRPSFPRRAATVAFEVLPSLKWMPILLA